jgi:hypothetical protein
MVNKTRRVFDALIFVAMVVLLAVSIESFLSIKTFAQQTLRQEFERTGQYQPLIDQNTRMLDRHDERIDELNKRMSALQASFDVLRIDARLSLIEKYIVSQEETYKLLWGTLGLLILKELWSLITNRQRNQNNSRSIIGG